MRNIIIPIIVIIIVSACGSMKNQKIEHSSNSYAVKQTIVYKTIGDFNHLVPIIMNADRTEIVSYPAPSDLITNGKYSTPTQLNKGYLLDNRGVNVNTVFLNYTYEYYTKLDQAPSLADMMLNIAERHPFTQLIHCGSRYRFKDEIKEVNLLIDKDFPDCSKLAITPMHIKSH